MMRRYFSFHARHQPYMARHSYTHELRSAGTFPLASSLAEGAFTGVVAAKYFGAGVVLMSLITAAPMFGNIMALFWSELSMGRRKVPLVNRLQLGVVLMIASVALTVFLPREVGGWVFAAQIVIARVMASGINTIRSAIWRANYPREIRGQVTSRIAVVATAALAATTFIGSYLLDGNPRAFVYLYPGAALIGVWGILQFRKIRVRRESQLLRREQAVYAPRPENIAQTEEGTVMNYMPEPRVGRFNWHRAFGQAWQILREDKAFRDYQRWQFLSGFSFMMMTPTLIYMVSTQMTDPTRDYLLSTCVLQIVPMVMALTCTQLWAPLFDRVHITVFRVYQGWISLAAHLMLSAGALWGWYVGDRGTGALMIVALGQVLIGITNAGGALAWNLGHNDFAPAERASAYMGVHVMLTGLRGCFAPFLGAWLYSLPFVGRRVFILSAVVALISTLGFMSMARKAPKKITREKITPPDHVKIREGSRPPHRKSATVSNR